MSFNIITSMSPGSANMPSNVLEGYKPVSRNNEQIQNAFVDTTEWNTLKTDTPVQMNTTATPIVDPLPPFHEWATVLPGEICVSRKDHAMAFKNKMIAESAAPVIGCAQCKGPSDDNKWFFAGVCRSKTVREYNDGLGPKIDEMFTLFIGGMATLLNNGSGEIHPGDVIEWTFADAIGSSPFFLKVKGPRRIQVRSVMGNYGSQTLRRSFGRAMSFAKKNETFDCLIGSTSM
jgi:hypothetical protein